MRRESPAENDRRELTSILIELIGLRQKHLIVLGGVTFEAPTKIQVYFHGLLDAIEEELMSPLPDTLKEMS